MYYDVHIELKMKNHPNHAAAAEIFKQMDDCIRSFRGYRGEKYLRCLTCYTGQDCELDHMGVVAGEFEDLRGARLAISEFEDFIRYLPDVENYVIWKEKAR